MIVVQAQALNFEALKDVLDVDSDRNVQPRQR
jgi:hypothetical protein